MLGDLALLHIGFILAGLIYEGVWMEWRALLQAQLLLPLFYTIVITSYSIHYTKLYDIAADDIPQLGKLIEAGGPQKGADPGYPAVVATGRLRAVRIACFGPHCAQFQHVEESVAPAQPPLDEQHRPAILQLDAQRSPQQYGRQNQQSSYNFV